MHLDPSSYDDLDRINSEKTVLENVAGTSIYGNRVHYTMNNDILYENLQELSFKYDSSARFGRERIVDEDFGYFKKGKLVVFPITIMDALAFTYFVKTENEVVDFVKHVISKCRKMSNEKKIITILWHDCALRMRKGRLYTEVLRYLTSLNGIEIRRGIDLFEMIDKGMK